MVEYLFWRLKIYAIIENSGKQYRVTPGQTLDVDRVNAAVGDTVELDRVLLVADEATVTAGKPLVDGAKVLATVQREGKGEKVVVLKYKSKTRYRRKKGHRQFFTRLSIEKIVMPGETPAEPARKPRRRKIEEAADGT